MRKVRTWIILGAIVAAIIGALAVAAANLNAYLNRNKDWLTAQAEAAIGRRVGFAEIGVSIRGGLGVHVSNLTVADDPAFSSEDFLRADGVRVAVKILPALRGRYEVRRFVLDRPSITVIQTARGLNVDSLGAPAGKQPADKVGSRAADPTRAQRAGRDWTLTREAHAAQPAATAGQERAGQAPAAPPRNPAAGAPSNPAAASSNPAGASSKPGGALPPVSIAKVAIRDGELRFIDRTAGASAREQRELKISRLDVSASDVGFTKPVSMDIAAAVLGGEKQNVFVKGTVGPIGERVDPNRLAVAATVSLDPLDVGAIRRAVPAMAAQLPPELQIDGPLRLKASVSGTAAAPQVSDVSFDADAANVAYAAAFTKPKGVPFQLRLGKATRSNGKLEIADAALRLAGADVKAGGSIDAGSGAMDLRIDLGRTELDGWQRILPAVAAYELEGTLGGQLHTTGAVGPGKAPRVDGTIELRGIGVRGKDLPAIEGLSSTIALKGDSAILPATKFTVGGSPVEVEATVERFAAPQIRFALRSAELRLASFGAAGDGTASTDALRNLSVDGVLATAGPKPEFQGTLRSAQGALQQTAYEDLQANVRLENDVATLDKLAVKLGGGTYNGSGRYDMTNADLPSFAFQSAIRGVALAPFLGPQFPGAAQMIEGRLDADLSLAGAGATWETIRGRLTGDGRADVVDGKLKGINLAEAVLGGATGVPGLAVLVPAKIQKKHPALFGAEDTAFERCGGSVRIQNGRVATEDLGLRARDYDVRGRGWFSFENQVDFTATLVASEALSREAIGEVSLVKHLANSAGRVEIPFRFAGTLPNVRPQPDTSALARAAQGALISEGLGELLGGKGKGKGKGAAQGGGAAGQGAAGSAAPAAGAGTPQTPPSLGDVLQGVLGPKEKAPAQQGKRRKEKAGRAGAAQ